MFIQTEATPNPNTLKFLPGRAVLETGSADFPNEDAAKASPLAARLFEVEGVTGVFFGADFITVTKSDADNQDWPHLKPAILASIMDHFTAGLPIMGEGEADRVAAKPSAADYEGADAEIVEQIIELLDTRVRPAVANDGGDIIFHHYEQGIVTLTMQGACAGCPASTMTLKQGIENMLRHYIPEVQEVRPVEDMPA
ncbi:MAG: NifU family protein [Alphaproteobacteria bacterium]